jgi:hypothetical protein
MRRFQMLAALLFVVISLVRNLSFCERQHHSSAWLATIIMTTLAVDRRAECAWSSDKLSAPHP